MLNPAAGQGGGARKKAAKPPKPSARGESLAKQRARPAPHPRPPRRRVLPLINFDSEGVRNASIPLRQLKVLVQCSFTLFNESLFIFDCEPFPGVFSTSFAHLFTGRLTTEIGSGLNKVRPGGDAAMLPNHWGYCHQIILSLARVNLN